MNHRKYTKNNESGVVMMETLLTLPLYMVMLACLFWLGEVCILRSTLLNTERLSIWEHSNRHQSTDTYRTAAALFSFLPEGNGTAHELVTSYSGYSKPVVVTNTPARNWGRIVTGRAFINNCRSLWSWGIDSTVKEHLWNGNSESEPTDIMVARGTIELPLTSYLLSRGTGVSNRSGTASYAGARGLGSSEWVNIARGSWGNFVIPPAVGVNFITSLYNRNTTYDAWSR